MPELAIVIPAYKPSFFAAALESIAAQTDQGFTVYVGDDASPHDLASICSAYQDRIALRYTRFEHNLGQSALVAHWQRCIGLSQEPWVWLFSDDDLMDPGCVAAWRQRVVADAGAVDLYHFDVIEIDAAGAVLAHAPRFADLTRPLAYALARLQGRLSSYAPDYVFLRAALARVGGFEDFPAAWCSDDATWIKLARRGGIRAIRGPVVRWRRSGQNISAADSPQKVHKLLAASQYVGWLEQHVAAGPVEPGEPTRNELMTAARPWLLAQRQTLNTAFWPRHGLAHAWHLRRALPGGLPGSTARTLYWDLRSRLRAW